MSQLPTHFASCLSKAVVNKLYASVAVVKVRELDERRFAARNSPRQAEEKVETIGAHLQRWRLRFLRTHTVKN